MADGLAAAATRYAGLAKSLNDLPRLTARKVGAAGRVEFNQFAASKWGGDRRFSGAARSRKAKARAGVRYDVEADGARIVFTPTGAPWYITVKGRKGGAVIRPRKGHKALRTPQGIRAVSHVGALRAQPNLMRPVVPKVERAGVDATHKVWVDQMKKVVG